VGGGLAKKAGQQAMKALDTDGDGEISIVRERMPNQCLRICRCHHLLSSPVLTLSLSG
jgi:hypothetical protein